MLPEGVLNPINCVLNPINCCGAVLFSLDLERMHGLFQGFRKA